MAERLQPGERTSHRLQITDETGEGWLKVRENIPSLQLAGDRGNRHHQVHDGLRTSARTLAYPMRNPWLSATWKICQKCYLDGEHVGTSGRGVAVLFGGQSLLGAERGSLGARADTHLFKRVPSSGSALRGAAGPGGARRQLVVSIKPQGELIVLQMPRPLGTGVKVVDSTIKFGGEVTPEK
jgi:hypothetical protein